MHFDRLTACFALLLIRFCMYVTFTACLSIYHYLVLLWFLACSGSGHLWIWDWLQGLQAGLAGHCACSHQGGSTRSSDSSQHLRSPCEAVQRGQLQEGRALPRGWQSGDSWWNWCICARCQCGAERTGHLGLYAVYTSFDRYCEWMWLMETMVVASGWINWTWI